MTNNYTVIRSKRRTLALEITKDMILLVRAPMRTSQKDIDHMVDKHASWIKFHMEKQRQRIEARPEPTLEECELLRKRAKFHIPSRVEHFSRLMGLLPTGITITSAEKRFGSCSPVNRLCFSWRLMRYPEEAIDYVVVHELAHIRHKNHGKDFYQLIEAFLPDFKARKNLLKD